MFSRIFKNPFSSFQILPLSDDQKQIHSQQQQQQSSQPYSRKYFILSSSSFCSNTVSEDNTYSEELEVVSEYDSLHTFLEDYYSKDKKTNKYSRKRKSITHKATSEVLSSNTQSHRSFITQLKKRYHLPSQTSSSCSSSSSSLPPPKSSPGSVSESWADEKPQHRHRFSPYAKEVIATVNGSFDVIEAIETECNIKETYHPYHRRKNNSNHATAHPSHSSISETKVQSVILS